MKKIYIAPQADIETLGLNGSFMEDDDPGYAKYSWDSDEMHANTTGFDEDDQGESFPTTTNLWDE